MALQSKHPYCSKTFTTGPLKLAMWCAKWRIKLNPTKTKVIIFSRSILARKNRTQPKTRKPWTAAIPGTTV